MISTVISIPHDFILQREAAGSLARVHAFVQKARETYKDNLILLDNGDILQGQPTAYYYNYIDTVSLHVTADMLNFMGYDAANMGNHDVETGRAVFDRWAGDCRAPVLGANIIDTATGEPHFRALQGAGARRSEDCRSRHDNARHSGVALRESVAGASF